jgi:basic membrane protein A and related proteins
MKKRLVTLSLLLVVTLALGSFGTPRAAFAQDKPVKIGIIMPSAKNDLAWSQAIYDSLVAVQTEMGGESKVELTVIENMFMVPDAAANAQKFAGEGYDIVIMHGTQYGASLFEIAAQFPDVSFAYGTSQDVGKEQGLENVFAYEARAEEGGYVFGWIAGKMTKTNVIGVVGPVNAGDAKLYIDGFEEGAKAANAAVDVKKIFTESFGDIPKATEAAKTLLSQNADILTGSAQQVPGAITETQKAGKIWFSTDVDQSSQWPDTVAASMVYDWKAMLTDMITQRAAGVKGGIAYDISFANGNLKIVFNDKVAIPEDVMKEAEDAMAKIKDGSLIVVGSPAAMAEATPEATP